ncbi:MAG: pseudouridine synthase [Rickettsiales bacterium]
MTQLERIAKVIARRGYCSRRDAEELIFNGQVKLDGIVVTTPATKVAADANIEIEGHNLDKKTQTRLWIFHKPKGCLTTSRDTHDRPTIYDFLPEDLPRVITIGRLDFNTEGLLLLTNDGEFARQFELPSSNLDRVYRVRAFGEIEKNMLSQLAKGIEIDGVQYRPVRCEIDSSKGDNHWLTMTLTEGKNREIRKVLEYFGLKVNRLIRLKYGNYSLGSLPTSALNEVSLPQL